MPSKLQKGRSKYAAIMIDRREGLLASSKVVDDDYWQKKELQRLKKRLNLYPLSLLMV
jgi:hypothetical protein